VLTHAANYSAVLFLDVDLKHSHGSVINLSDFLETCRDCTAPGSRPWDVSLWQ